MTLCPGDRDFFTLRNPKMEADMLRKVLSLSAALCALLTTVILADTNVFPPNGNVGIGTTTPGAKLDVGAGMSPRSGYTDALIGSGGDVPQLELFHTNKSAAISYDGTTLNFFTNGTPWKQAMVVDNSGNVGIGAIPSERLEVSGAGNQRIRITTTDGTGSPSLQFNGTGGLSAIYNYLDKGTCDSLPAVLTG